MYIESITIKNFRTFKNVKVEFSHKDREPDDLLPSPKLKNINLLLGNNGLGKTTLLKAISLSALGPAVADSGIFPYRLVRREPDERHSTAALRNTEEVQPDREAILEAVFKTHRQDELPINIVESRITISRRGDLEQLRWAHHEEKPWFPIFSSSSAAFFFVGYGASRRVEKRDQSNISSRSQNYFVRAQRIQSIFEDSYSLLPLNTWLPAYKLENPDLYEQVINLINKLLGKGHYQFKGEIEADEFVFERGGLKIPFPALSDGYRAYLGWICDLLFHVCVTCPPGSELIDNHGIVMVDEIDLHIHPKWQVNILPVLAKTLPNIQFIVTSHSPLVAGSLEWMNILVMSPGIKQSSTPTRLKESIHGLDADQILLTGFFGMESTRAPKKETQLQKLTVKARQGDVNAAKKLLEELTKGME